MDLSQIIPERKSFLPEKLVMIDCEMEGVVPNRDKLLQVAMFKLSLKDNQYVIIDEPLVLYMKNDKQPTTEFHKTYLSHIFEKCNKSDLTPEKAKEQINKWLGDWKGVVQPCGDCIPNDITFLYAEDLIDRGDIVNGENVPGTFHYEFFELNSIKSVARTLAGFKVDKDLPGMSKTIHDAIDDCKNQIKELNLYLSILLGNRESFYA